jgi:aryl-alcohol dehydrogenase-like predicted oxidoreductase
MTMRYRALGETGPIVSGVGLGGNNFGSRLDADATKAVVHAALDAGITLFDTADTYGAYGGGRAGDSERLLGAAVAGHREQVVLATKFGMACAGPLANGLLSGKYRRGEDPPPGSRLSWRQGWLTDAALDRVEALTAYGAERGCTLLQVAVGGLAAQPAVGSVICGAMTPEQVVANAAAAHWSPDAADLAALDEIVPPGQRVV